MARTWLCKGFNRLKQVKYSFPENGWLGFSDFRHPHDDCGVGKSNRWLYWMREDGIGAGEKIENEENKAAWEPRKSKKTMKPMEV